MSREVLLLVEPWHGEKNVDKEIVFGALELHWLSATKKRFGEEEADVRVSIDRIRRNTNLSVAGKSWMTRILKRLSCNIKLEEAQKIDPNYQIGEFVEEPLESIDFGRIRCASCPSSDFPEDTPMRKREQILATLWSRSEHLVSGTVKRIERGNAIIEFGKIDGLAAARSNDTRKKTCVWAIVYALICCVLIAPCAALKSYCRAYTTVFDQAV